MRFEPETLIINTKKCQYKTFSWFIEFIIRYNACNCMSIICFTWVVGQLMHPSDYCLEYLDFRRKKIKILHYWGQRYIRAAISGKKDPIAEEDDPGFTNSSQSTWLSITITIMEWLSVSGWCTQQLVK